MRRRNYVAKTLVVAVLGITLHSVWNSPTQEAADAESALHVGGEEGRETQLEMSQIAKLPRLSVRAKDEQGKESVWEGTPLHEVLKAAGAKFGEAIPGKGSRIMFSRRPPTDTKLFLQYQNWIRS